MELRQQLLQPSRSPRYTSDHGSPNTPWNAFDAAMSKVESLCETGDFAQAELILETLCEVFFERWYVESVELSDYGDEAMEFVEELGALWVMLIEGALPSERQQQHWQVSLQSWQTQLQNYGQADGLQNALDSLDRLF